MYFKVTWLFNEREVVSAVHAMDLRKFRTEHICLKIEGL